MKQRPTEALANRVLVEGIERIKLVSLAEDESRDNRLLIRYQKLEVTFRFPFC